MPDTQVQSINPANGEVIESFTPLTHKPAARAAARACAATCAATQSARRESPGILVRIICGALCAMITKRVPLHAQYAAV